MLFSLYASLLALLWTGNAIALVTGKPDVAVSKPTKRELLQDLVTWDEHSLIVRGERVMFFSGEFHPFRLPSPGLWLDVFQKIKAMGFNGVSFYTDWGLLEGNPGHIITDGIFSLDEFFNAATEAGLYLIARPGPYINAETAAGGFPGWLLRLKGVLRSMDSDYLNATQNYVTTLGKIVADAQITNGGPIVLVQPENEYSNYPGVTDFPDEMNKEYMAFVEKQYRDAGIVVPFIDNDNLVLGSFAPGTGLGEVDIYGIDAYPLRYDCAHPEIWPTYRWPVNWQLTHQEQSPSTPFAIPEYQGGSGTGWGGVIEEMCNALFNQEAARVLYKNNYSFGVKLMNIYMTYGGTDWGNLGYDGDFTSYDYGAAISEDRHVWREKYSEQKLQANFFKVSPAYLTATAGNATNGTYASTSAINVTPLLGNGTRSNFYVARHANWTSTARTSYKLTVTTSAGNVSIPQLGGSLMMNGRDAKIHVTDYDVGGVNLIYSSAEVYTWTRTAGDGRVLVLYGGASETHEFAVSSSLGTPMVSEGNSTTIFNQGPAYVIQWKVESTRQVLHFGEDLEVHLLWRNEAYSYWVLELPAAEPIGNYTSPSKSYVIINGGYLLRTALLDSQALQITGDVNTTTTLEVISTPADGVSSLFFNGRSLKTSKTTAGRLKGTVLFESPTISVPDFTSAEWRYLDSLPEIQSVYDDSQWTFCSNPRTNNPRNLTTPTSLYASDYGYHTGSLIYRGHFFSNGNESTFFANVSGGSGFGHSAWLNGSFIGSWTGSGSNSTYPSTFQLPKLLAAQPYVITLLIDHMGQTEEGPGTDAVKQPRSLLDFNLSGHPATDVTWKISGNLGGEQYKDLARGPRNEGAMFAERQGYHLPGAPFSNWTISNPINVGISKAGIGFYATNFELHVPSGFDAPMSFIFNNSAAAKGTVTNSASGFNYRCQLFVNGYQFGKYVNNVGPQTVFPVPEGILNHHGTNYVALTLWAQDAQGARIDGLELVPQMPVMSGYRTPWLAPMPGWTKRNDAY